MFLKYQLSKKKIIILILDLSFFRFPLDLTDDVDYLRGLSWDQRNEEENHILDRGRSQVSQEQQTQLLDTLQVTFSINYWTFY